MSQFVSILVPNEPKNGTFSAPISLIMKGSESYISKKMERCVLLFLIVLDQRCMSALLLASFTQVELLQTIAWLMS